MAQRHATSKKVANRKGLYGVMINHGGPWIQVVRPLDPSCVEADTTRCGGTVAEPWRLAFWGTFFRGFPWWLFLGG